MVQIHGDTDFGLLGVLLNLFGIFGSIVGSIAQTLTRFELLKSNKLVALLSLIAVSLFWLLMDDKTLTICTTSLLGFVNLPICFVAYELAVQ